MARWSLDNISWEKFDRSKVTPELLALAKAAALVEYNGSDYATYLKSIFANDPDFQNEADRWAVEEVQHGAALARWAKIADPSFDFEGAFGKFTDHIKIPLEAKESVRGSRAGELVARCIVESGTSSYYTALSEAADEPVLKEICRNIAADELRHYKLFYEYLRHYLDKEGIGRWQRLKIALGRIFESEDDELTYAYYAANEPHAQFDRKYFASIYAKRAYSYYRRHHIERGIAMVLKAVGLTPNGRLQRTLSEIAWRFMSWRAGRGQAA